jgi:pyruvate formate lyase activating enzyme
MLKIHSVETFGTHEGPGIRLVIFTQGCNWHCLYCQNPDTQTSQGGHAISAEEILKRLEKEKPYFSKEGGITFTGGEPTFQAEELLPICQEIKAKGYHIALDTNGSILTDTVKKLYDITDLVLLDVKHINPEWHKKVTGADNENVLKMAEYREKSKKPFWIRYVLVPGYTDQKEYLHQFGQYFQNYRHLDRVEILPYHTLGKYKYEELGRDYKLKDTPVPTKDQIDFAQKIFKKYIKNVFIR